MIIAAQSVPQATLTPRFGGHRSVDLREPAYVGPRPCRFTAAPSPAMFRAQTAPFVSPGTVGDEIADLSAILGSEPRSHGGPRKTWQVLFVRAAKPTK
jgi:hypothetical protein